jgi:hypothetical protein
MQALFSMEARGGKLQSGSDAVFWETLVLGVVLLAAAINLYGVVPRPLRIVIGLAGTALMLGATIFL